jgi:hypothetical protein
MRRCPQTYPLMRGLRDKLCRTPMHCRSRARRGHLLHPLTRRHPFQLRRIRTRNSPRKVSRGRMRQHLGRVNRKPAVRLKPRKPSRSFRKRREGQTRLRRHRRHPNRLPRLQNPRRRPRRNLKYNELSRHVGPHHRRVRRRRWQGQRLRRPEWPRRRPLDRPRRPRGQRPRLPVRRHRHVQLRPRDRLRRRDRPQPRNARRMFRDAENESGPTSF